MIDCNTFVERGTYYFDTTVKGTETNFPGSADGNTGKYCGYLEVFFGNLTGTRVFQRFTSGLNTTAIPYATSYKRLLIGSNWSNWVRETVTDIDETNHTLIIS